jgi:hypothetical protein
MSVSSEHASACASQQQLQQQQDKYCHTAHVLFDALITTA